MDGALSVRVGMNLWFAPQISEHCPYRITGRLTEDLVWFSRPGVACAFIPSLGIVHVCSTYVVVTIIQVGEFMGRTIGLSVYGSRKVLVSYSACDNIYESNFSSVKSENSYLQCHWCSTAFNVSVRL